MFKKLLAVMASAVMFVPLTANAEELTATIPVTVEGTDSAKVTISSDDENAMDAIVGETTIDVTDSTAFQIKYDEPVSYTYTLTQVAGDDAEVTYDANEYTAHVFVEAEEDGTLTPHVVVWKTESADKSDGVHFTNVKKVKEPEATATPEPQKSADTSDNSNTLKYIAGIGLGAGLLIVLLALRHRAGKAEQ